MKKAALYLSEIGKRILFIGLSIQIILGIVWMCFNFNSLQQYPVTGAFLYNHLILKLKGVYPLLYLLQLVAAFWSACHLLRQCKMISRGGRLPEIWGGLAIITFPMAMQCHMALSPYSFIGTLLMLEFSFMLKMLRGGRRDTTRSLVCMGACWLLLSLLMPEYVILGGVPILVGVIFCLKKLIYLKRSMMSVLILVCAICGIVTGVARITGQEKTLTKENIAYSLFWRTSWTFMRGDSGMWEPELYWSILPEYTEATVRPNAMETVFRPKLEEYFTDEEFVSFCMERAMVNIRFHGSVILKEMIWDVAGYAVTPLVLPMQLKGHGYDSYSGYNYETMRMNAPLLTKYYVSYSCRWFAIMLVTSLSCLFIGRFCESISRKKLADSMWSVAAVILSVCIMLLFYTMRSAGMMDYKCLYIVNQIWVIGALSMWRKEV